MDGTPAAAYCGAPPSPAQLWARWNLDPVLIAGLALVLVAYFMGAHRARLDGGRRVAFAAGWGAASLALVSPLCALSVSLFAARVGQHMFLAAVAAPLVAWGRPEAAAMGLVRRAPVARGASPAAAPLLAAVTFALLLAYWHTPAPYTVTFESAFVYWLMHLTLFGSAVWLWSALLRPDAQLAPAAAAVGLTALQMSLIGAVITFAPRPLYPPHLLTPYAWGLTPLSDQQLGGALMWAPAGVILVAALVAGVARLLARADRPASGAAAA